LARALAWEQARQAEYFSKDLYNVHDPDSTVFRFLRYHREVYGNGTLDPALIEVV